jgi:pyruvate dehydrogenase phosphatase
MFRQVWKPLAATVVVGAPAYIVYRKYCLPQTFDLPVRTKNSAGKAEMTTKQFTLLPLKDLEARLHENAVSETTTRPNGITWKYFTSNLASNDPSEDAHANQIVERDPDDPSSPGDYLFFAVMDGHGGTETSKLLSRILIKGVAMELANLVSKSATSAHSLGLMNSFKSIFSRPPFQHSLDGDPTHVSRAVEESFTKLDSELLQTPLRILLNSIDPESFKTKTIPDLSKHPLALTLMRPAIAGRFFFYFLGLSSFLPFIGSCALLAIFDTAHRDLYVACTGDSRAVAGLWEPSENGKGQWRIEVLTEDQTGRNPSELAR